MSHINTLVVIVLIFMCFPAAYCIITFSNWLLTTRLVLHISTMLTAIMSDLRSWYRTKLESNRLRKSLGKYAQWYKDEEELMIERSDPDDSLQLQNGPIEVISDVHYETGSTIVSLEGAAAHCDSGSD